MFSGNITVSPLAFVFHLGSEGGLERCDFASRGKFGTVNVSNRGCPKWPHQEDIIANE